MSIQKTVAVILGGGEGRRLYPLTADRSKPAVPICGKYRLIDIPISNCLNSDLRRMFVLTQFNSASLNRHIRTAYHFDTFSSGFVDLLAAEQTRSNQGWFLGTADAVRQSFPKFTALDYDYMMILSGDQLYQMDFRDVIARHQATGADLTVATIPVNAEDATGFGIMKVDKEDTIVNFVEKPSAEELPNWKSPLDAKFTSGGKDYLASMGIYVFSREAMFRLFDERPSALDFGKELIPFAVNSDSYKVASYPFGGYWTDIGSISSYFAANLYLTSYLPAFNMYDNVNQIYTRGRMLSPSKIFGTRLTHALISDGCIIHADRVSHSVIGIRSRIGQGTVINQSIVSGNDYYQALNKMKEEPDKLLGIGKNCYIERAILDKNVKIGNDVSIVGHRSLKDQDEALYTIKDGIIIIKRAAVIPDGTSIGRPISG